MKKGISEQKVKRMRNILTGKYNSKSKIMSGYTKKVTEYKEGDIWEEKDKKWTIKNGVRQTINKLDFARKINKIPYVCPKCSTSLKHPAHKQMYKRWGQCLTCITNWSLKMQKDGTYEEWHREFDSENFNAYIQDIQEEYEDWLDKRNSNHYITEAGQIEDWNGGQSSEEVAKQFYKTIEKVQENRNENKQDTTNN